MGYGLDRSYLPRIYVSFYISIVENMASLYDYPTLQAMRPVFDVNSIDEVSDYER